VKVLLLFPPSWTPTMPHLALPALTAYLRSHGVEVIQRDLNLETLGEILTRDYVEQAVARLRQDYGSHSNRQPAALAGPKRNRVQWALTHGLQLAAQVEEAVDVIRGDAFFDGPVGLQAFECVLQCLEVASLPFYPASLGLSSYIPPLPVDSSHGLLQAVRDPQCNIFLDIYQRGVIADIEREQPDIIGISIPTMGQMLAGMTLGYLIKEAGLPWHVTVGGPHISMLREELPRVPAIFDLFDSAVVFDGEMPLLRLAEVLDTDRDLSRAPNLIYRDGHRNGDQIRVTAYEEPEKIGDLPQPDFDGLPLDRYLSPKLVLPLLTSRGCYHGKCAFCNVGYGGPTSFCQLRAEQVVDQMMTLKRKYDVRHIFFADEAITPRNLRGMSSLLEELGTPIYWGGCARFEKVISGELLESMYRGGCRMLLFGLEAAAEPVIRQIGKGVEIEQVGRILRESSEAGIWNHVFFFFGFPGETIEEAQETVNFLYEYKSYINSAAFGTFLLERYAPAHRFPERYGIKRVVKASDKDLAIYFDYEVESGMDEELAELVASRFLDVLPAKRFGHYYVNDVYRFLYVSDLREHGIPLPPWLVPEETDVSQWVDERAV
jgi:anaerobic magnesium-protoporphyrin IX monomethyl ester cyclase